MKPSLKESTPALPGNQTTAILWLIALLGWLMPNVSVVPTNTTITLTGRGPLDWVHWGLNAEFAYDRKAVAPNVAAKKVAW